MSDRFAVTKRVKFCNFDHENRGLVYLHISPDNKATYYLRSTEGKWYLYDYDKAKTLCYAGKDQQYEEVQPEGVNFLEFKDYMLMLDTQAVPMGDFLPKGRFVCNREKFVVGVDNDNGHAWTEAFVHLEDCLQWLGGVEREDLNG